MRIRRGELKGFSLIELLIVVAIIAILSSIGVVNLLQAQTRSKITRAKADMRTLAVAIEAYNVDHKAYPQPADQLGILGSPFAVSGFDTRISSIITTPIAYMSSVIHEPFAGPADQESPFFHYSTRAYFDSFNMALSAPIPDTDLDQYVTSVFPSLVGSVAFFLLSHGPDSDHDTPLSGVPALYDPTNGVVSNGDVVYWGPGTGLRN